MSRSRSDAAGYSHTIIDGRREMGDINPIFGHYEARGRKRVVAKLRLSAPNPRRVDNHKLLQEGHDVFSYSRQPRPYSLNERRRCDTIPASRFLGGIHHWVVQDTGRVRVFPRFCVRSLSQAGLADNHLYTVARFDGIPDKRIFVALERAIDRNPSRMRWNCHVPTSFCCVRRRRGNHDE